MGLRCLVSDALAVEAWRLARVAVGRACGEPHPSRWAWRALVIGQHFPKDLRTEAAGLWASFCFESEVGREELEADALSVERMARALSAINYLIEKGVVRRKRDVQRLMSEAEKRAGDARMALREQQARRRSEARK